MTIHKNQIATTRDRLSGHDGSGIDRILASLPFRVAGYEEVGRGRAGLTAHYVVDSPDARAFLKVQRPPRGMLGAAARRLFGHPAFTRQIAVHHALEKANPAHLRFPRLIATDNRTYLLLEYIPRGDSGALTPEERHELVRGLLEFNGANLELRQKQPARSIIDTTFHPILRLLLRAGHGLSRRYGASFVAACAAAVRDCRARQPRLPTSVLLHNDFHHNNVFRSRDGAIYMTDFENVVATRRWPLLDIVHYAVDTRSGHVDHDIITLYLRERAASPLAALALDIDTQLRFGLLRRMLLGLVSSAPPPDVREGFRTFIGESLLEHERFVRWRRAALPEAS